MKWVDARAIAKRLFRIEPSPFKQCAASNGVLVIPGDGEQIVVHNLADLELLEGTCRLAILQQKQKPT